jgi:hypothetical protein
VLTNNGGPTVGATPSSLTLETEALLNGSPAIDKGVANTLTVDERGFPRPDVGTGEKPDVGAFEFQDVTLTVSISASSSVTIGRTFNLNVMLTNTSANALPADGTTLTVTLAAGLTPAPGSTLTFTVGPIAAGASKTFTVTVTATGLGPQTVTATVMSPDTTPNTITTSATITVMNFRPIIAVGAGFGALSEIKVFDAGTTNLLLDFFAFGGGFTGGVRVAVGDVNGDGIPDIIAVTGPGASEIKVFNGANSAVLFDYFANFSFNPGFTGGLFVAAGDVNKDGHADILVGPDVGGNAEVKVFSGTNAAVLYDFYAFNPGFTGGVHVALGDVDGDGRADLITMTGANASPEVRIFSGLNGMMLQDYFPPVVGGK